MDGGNLVYMTTASPLFLKQFHFKMDKTQSFVLKQCKQNHVVDFMSILKHVASLSKENIVVLQISEQFKLQLGQVIHWRCSCSK